MALAAEDDDALVFADEHLASRVEPREPWLVLVVDDEPEVHAVTRLALADLRIDGRPLALLSANDGLAARAILQTRPELALVLLDVVMESEHAGLELARWIREQLGNTRVRVVLRTGQPGSAPEQQVMLEYDINDYRSKTEVTAQRLVTTVIAGIRSYRDLCTIESQKHGLEQVVAATLSIFETASFSDMIRGILLQISALLSPRRNAMFIQGKGPLFGVLAGAGPVVLAGTGRYAQSIGQPAVDQVAGPIWSDILAAVEQGQAIHGEGYSVFGLCHAGRSHSAIYIETHGQLSGWDSHLLELFCRNATVAFDNLHLHQLQLALTRVFERFVPKRALELLGVSDITTIAVGDHQQREMSVLFLDLRSFTRLAERMSASAIYAFVNALFATLVPEIDAQGGVVDSYTGDGLIALFPTGPSAAVLAGIALIGATRRFADAHPELPLRPRIGVGIHHGPMIVGLCGAADRLAFTAVGDGINIAARVERLTRDYDTNLLLTAAAHAGLPADLQARCRSIGEVTLRGKLAPAELFELGPSEPERAGR